MRRDYYAVLGIAATALPREIRQAYRRLARQYSPDVNFWDHQARRIFEEIAEAYRVLSDPAARDLYDRFGAAISAEAIDNPRRGDDVHATVELSFAEAAHGLTFDLEVLRFSPCAACVARGTVEGRTCPRCGGRGVRRSRDKVRLIVPAGVDNGAQIRIQGEGDAAPFAGPRGDLVISTRVAEHPFFKRKGDHLHCEVPITVWEALRGARVRVPTPTGETVLVVPPGTAAGQVFRLRGQGLPRLTEEGTGDLFVTIRLDVPTGLDARTDELVRELERLLPAAPREGLERFRGGGG
jgi:molecular chaperone DnaJ